MLKFKFSSFIKTLRFRLGMLFFLFTLPLILLLIFSNNYAMRVVHNQVSQSNKNLISLYMGQIDRNLQETDNYLYNLVAQETDLLNLDQTYNNNQSYYSAKIRLSNKITTDIDNYKEMDMFFIYSSLNQDLLVTSYRDGTFEAVDRIKNELLVTFQHQQALSPCLEKWCVRKVGEEYYLSHIAKVGGVFVGAWTNVKKMMVPLKLIDIGKDGLSVFVSNTYGSLNNTDFIKENNIDLTLVNEKYSITGAKDKFLMVGEKSQKGDLSLIVLISDYQILEGLPFLKIITYLIPIFSILILLLLLFFLRNLILIPIYRIVKKMEKIERGIWEVQINNISSSIEFEIMDKTFNSMVSQIQKLKIDIYEEQLSKQRAELKYLLLQINPHFFLNSLSIIFHLARARNYKLIEEMANCLVEYFRFMFRGEVTFISLEEEIKHTDNYLKIQAMRYPNYLSYEYSLPDSHKAFLVPPLVVHTFVENTIKHAVTMDEPIHITISVIPDMLGDNSNIQIRIQDSGKGFSDEILRQLQSDEEMVNEQGEHIGIWNVKRRLNLLYNNQSQILFSNSPNSGATVDIYFPKYKQI